MNLSNLTLCAAIDASGLEIKKMSSIISQCEKVSDGNPAIYQLKPTASPPHAHNQVKRLIFGEPGSLTPVYTMLLVGETGSGKSTMLDALINYIYGVSINDTYRLRIRADPYNTQDDVTSQTSRVTCYTVFPTKYTTLPFAVNFIDTPGLGDTRGAERDRETITQMKELFESGVQYGVESLSCICMVAKSDLNRLTPSTKYVLDQTLALFSLDTKPNICVIGTHYTSSERVLDVLRSDKIPFTKSFFCNNSWLNNTSNKDVYKTAYEEFKTSCESFLAHLIHVLPCSLTLSALVIKERMLLDEAIQVLMERIQDNAYHIIWLKDKQKVFEEGKLVKTEVPFRKKILKKSLTKNQVCPKCKLVCLTNVGRFHAFKSLFRAKSLCDRCECPIETHFVSCEEYEVVTDKKLVAVGKDELSGLTKAIDQITEECSDKEKSIATALQAFHSSFKRLRKIALKPMLDSEEAYFDMAIKVEKREKRSGYLLYVRELERLKKIVSLKKFAESIDINVDALIEAWTS